jgi:Spy/CpxP family protein refolding chaperone
MNVHLFKIGIASARVFARPRLALALLTFALLLVGSETRARAQGQEPEPAPQEQPAPPRRVPPGNNLMQRLNLTPEQRAQLRDIRKQSEPEVRELTRRVRLARRALDEAVYADAVDEAQVEQRVRALTEAQAALLRLRSATELKVRRVLTPEQLQTFRDLRVQAQRQQLMQRRMRGVPRQMPPAGQNPPDASAPPDPARDPRPADATRTRPRGRLGRP